MDHLTMIAAEDLHLVVGVLVAMVVRDHLAVVHLSMTTTIEVMEDVLHHATTAHRHQEDTTQIPTTLEDLHHLLFEAMETRTHEVIRTHDLGALPAATDMLVAMVTKTDDTRMIVAIPVNQSVCASQAQQSMQPEYLRKKIALSQLGSSKNLVRIGKQDCHSAGLSSAQRTLARAVDTTNCFSIVHRHFPGLICRGDPKAGQIGLLPGGFFLYLGGSLTPLLLRT